MKIILKFLQSAVTTATNKIIFLFFNPFAGAQNAFQAIGGFFRVYTSWWYALVYKKLIPNLALGFGEVLEKCGADPSTWWFYYTRIFLANFLGYFVQLIPAAFLIFPLNVRQDLFVLFYRNMQDRALEQYLTIISRHGAEGTRLLFSTYMIASGLIFATFGTIAPDLFVFLTKNVVQPVGEAITGLFAGTSNNEIRSSIEGIYACPPEVWVKTFQNPISVSSEVIDPKYYNLIKRIETPSNDYFSLTGKTITSEYQLNEATLKEMVDRAKESKDQLLPIKVATEETTFSTPLQEEYKPSSSWWPTLTQVVVFTALAATFILCVYWAQQNATSVDNLAEVSEQLDGYEYDPNSPLGYSDPNEVSSDSGSSTSTSSGYDSDCSSADSDLVSEASTVDTMEAAQAMMALPVEGLSEQGLALHNQLLSASSFAEAKAIVAENSEMLRTIIESHGTSSDINNGSDFMPDPNGYTQDFIITPEMDVDGYQVLNNWYVCHMQTAAMTSDSVLNYCLNDQATFEGYSQWSSLDVPAEPNLVSTSAMELTGETLSDRRWALLDQLENATSTEEMKTLVRNNIEFILETIRGESPVHSDPDS